MKTNNKQREALETLVVLVDAWKDHLPPAIQDGELSKALEEAEAALSEPPRNCDRFDNAEDAKKEFNYLWNFVWKRGGGYVNEREYRSEYEKWLFATIQEGETNGSK